MKHPQHQVGDIIKRWRVIQLVRMPKSFQYLVECLNCQERTQRKMWNIEDACACCMWRDIPTPEQIEARKELVAPNPKSPSVSAVLSQFGYTRTKCGRTHQIYRHETLVFSGSIEGIWNWLRERHPSFFEDEP